MKKLFIILSVLIVAIGCEEETPNKKLDKEVRSQLEILFEDPTLMDNSDENTHFLNNFQDSGIYNSEKQKTGLWVEYKVEDLFNEVPITVVSTSGDSNQIRMTNIIKYIGEYENGEKINTWMRYKLINNNEPYEWIEDEKPITSVTITIAN